MKIYLNKKIVLGLTGFAFSVAFGYACADYGYNYIQSNFTPEIFVTKGLQPLNYEPNFKFYNNESYYSTGLNIADDLSTNTTDVSDWKRYIKVMSETEISAILYPGKNDATIQLAKLSKNTNKAVRSFAEFVNLAYKVDGYSDFEIDPWDYKPGPLMQVKLAKSIEDKFKNETDSFLKSRYWFLTLKAYFYSSDRTQVIRFFNETQANFLSHKYYVNAVDYLAGAYFYKKDYINANLAFAEVVTLDEAKLMPSAKDFKLLSNTDLNETLAKAKSLKIKEAIWAILAYKSDAKKALHELYTLNPNSYYLPVVLVRTLNLEEEKFTTFYEKEINDSDNNAYKKRAAKSVDDTLLKFIKSASENKNLENIQLWKLAYAYLSMYKGDYKTADKEYASLKNVTNDSLLKDQIRLFSFLNKILQTNKLSNSVNEDFITEYKWIMSDESYGYTNNETIRFYTSQQFIKNYLANIYKKNKDFVLADLLIKSPNFYKNDSNTILMEKFLNKKDLTNWEKTLLSQYNITIEDVNKQLAFKAILKDDLTLAKNYLDKVSSNHNSNFNPFNGLIKDRNIKESKKQLKYADVVNTMINLKNNISNNTDVYNNALLLANAYYNLSYYGNNREMYWNSIFLDLDSEYPSTAIYKYDNTLAIKYYNIALNNASDDEQKAKVTYLLTKIERNEFYTKSYFTNPDYYGYTEIMFKKFEGYKILKSKFSHTKYYKEVINECGYFKKYTNLG